jgi:hypothetical protein
MLKCSWLYQTFISMKHLIIRFCSLTIFTMAIFTIGCREGEVIQALEPDAAQVDQPADEVTLRASCSQVTDACASGNLANCVKYARCKVSSLPYGLTTYQNKKDIVNTQTASVGSVAVINVGNSTGHVAYVQSVSSSDVTIRETNWCRGATKATTRTGTKTALKIVGFYKP